MDYVWTANKVKWMELKEFLMLGDAESRIMVTIRSHDVAKAIGNSDIHVLEGLSPENSWHLFEMIAFEEKPNSQINPFEVEIAKKIVQQCSNVPLAIKVVGSLLCGQGLDKWQTFEKSGLGGICKGDNQIMSILKCSYHNLEPSLKSCFTFCAVFPKDYMIEKEMLIRHWMAHGYIVPFDRDQSVEKASEEHFLILLRRCFFQEVKMDKHGKIISFKMHDLIHDVAQEVAGQEILVATTEKINLGAKVRHVFQGSSKRDENFYSNVKVRSYLRIEPQILRCRVLGLPHGGCLRTLTLINVVMKTLPDSIDKLFHLRFLDLSGNGELETLPGSITKLHNLQTLKLQTCRRLRELPKKFRRLVNLMHLNIKGCSNIKYMPVGMYMLTSLCELTEFVVADESSSMDTQVGQLKDLKSLVNLKGRLDIKMQDDFKRAMVYDWEGSCLEGAEHLQKLCIYFHIDHSNYREDNDVLNDEALLEKLLPHPNVNELYLRLYRGVKFPSWGRADFNWANLLPNLVNIRIIYCHKLKHLPSLSKLKHLRQLTLEGLNELEYIEGTNCSSSDASSVSELKEEAECTFFPSLEFLNIEEVPKLKGWWPGLEFTESSSNARLWQQSFPRLSKFQFNCYSPKSTRNTMLPELWVGLGRADYLKSLPAGRLTKITLGDKELESLAELGDVFKNCSSLRTLRLDICNKLSCLSGGLEHLTMLESLNIISCTQLNWKDGMPWRRFHHNLRSLRLYDHNLQNLPEGMQYLSSLEKLTIEMCHNLEELPGGISCFSFLQSLTVFNCKKLKSIPEGVHNMGSLKRLRIAYCSRELKARYQDPDGGDWHKIQHIPKIDIW